MTVSLKHHFSSVIADDAGDLAGGKVVPSHWNAEHDLTGTANALFGFSAAGSGIDLTGTSWDVTNQALTLTGIANPAAPTLTLTGGTALTTSQPVLNMTQGWNNAGVTFSAIKLNVTATASAAASLLLDLQVGGVSKFNVRKDGVVLADFFGAPATTTGLSVSGTTTILYGNGAEGLRTTNACVGIGGAAVSSSTMLNFTAGTTGRSQMRLNAGVAPSSPTDGDIWFDGTDVKMRVSGATKTFTLV